MSISKQRLNQLILEEYTSILVTEQGRGERYPYPAPNITPSRTAQAIDATATPTMKYTDTGVAYTTGKTTATPGGNPEDLTGPGKYRDYSEIIDSMITNLSDDFKETKFYRAIKQIQRDIESDINSISNPDSEKRKKLNHDIQRLEKWTTGLVNCWSEWDCFINGPEYGIRPKLYSPEGIGISAFTSIFPPTRVATSAAFGILLADDIYRFDQGERGALIITDFIVDSLGVFAGGLGKAVAKNISKDVILVFEKVLIPVIEAGFKGATGAELRIALNWAKSSGNKYIANFLQVMKPIWDNISTFGSTIIQMIDNVGSTIGDWLRGLYNIPVIGDIAYEINRVVLAKLYEAKALLREFVASVTLALKGLWNLIHIPGTTVDAILTKLGFKIPGATRLAITVGTNAYIISKALHFYETWNQANIDAEMIAEADARLQAETNDIRGVKPYSDVQNQARIIDNGDDYAYIYEAKQAKETDISDQTRKNPIELLDFTKFTNVNLAVIILLYSPDRKYVKVQTFSNDENVPVAIFWIKSQYVKKEQWIKN